MIQKLHSVLWSATGFLYLVFLLQSSPSCVHMLHITRNLGHSCDVLYIHSMLMVCFCQLYPDEGCRIAAETVVSS